MFCEIYTLETYPLQMVTVQLPPPPSIVKILIALVLDSSLRVQFFWNLYWYTLTQTINEKDEWNCFLQNDIYISLSHHRSKINTIARRFKYLFKIHVFFFIRKPLFCLSLNFLNFSGNWGWDFLKIFLTFTGINWLKEVTLSLLDPIYTAPACCGIEDYCGIQDYQRKVSIFVKELAKNELISISGT